MLLQYKKHGWIGRISISNPPHGALTNPVFANREELISFLNDEEIKGVLIQGESNHFCSGADRESFRELFQDADSLEKNLNRAKELLEMLRFAPIPVVAVIHGCCLGAGLEIALSCHFRFAAKSAMLGFPESEYTLMPGLGGTILAQQLIGRSKLMELLLSGRTISAEEAMQLGLVDRVMLAAELEEAATVFLKGLVDRHPRELVQSVMEAVHNGTRLDMEEALLKESALFCRLAARAGEGGSEKE